MKNKRCVRIGILICFLTLLMAFWGTDERKMNLYAEKMNAQNAISDLSPAFSIILGQMPKDAREGYAIDEAFLLWLDRTYGDEVIINLANTIRDGSMVKDTWYQMTGNSIHVLWLMYCQRYGFETYRFEHVTWMDEKQTTNRSDIVMDFIGDINLDDSWYTMQAFHERGDLLEKSIDPQILEELKTADLTMANNEFTYSTRGTAIEGKPYCFRAEPSNAKLLTEMGIDVVSLANNHVSDYGEDAFLDTLDTLAEQKIDSVGAGDNLEEAKAALYYVIDGRKIAIVSATQIEKYYKYTKEATPDTPGVLKTLQPDVFIKAIAEAKRNSDYVIAYVHWGIEGMLWASDEERTLAQQFVEAGADAVIGAHAHRLQETGFISDVPVLYGIGNFWFSSGDIYTTIAQMRIDQTGNLKMRLLPCRQKNLYTQLLTEKEQKDAFYQYVADLSADIGIDADGYLSNIRGKETEDVLSGYAYVSGQAYATRTGGTDLSGNRVDVVGNVILE